MSHRPRTTAITGCRAIRSTLAAIGALMVALGFIAMSPTSAAAASGQVTIEKSTNGVDADSAPGPVLDPGTVVTWSYQITVGGDEILYDLIVSDSSGVVPSCDIDGNGTLDGTDYHPGPVAPGQSFVCGATGVVHGAQEGGFTSTGAVRAFDYSGEQAYEDEDRSHYTTVAPFNASPKMSIQTLINGGDADSSPGPYIAEGTAVVLTYVVTNSGNVPLTSISVANDADVPVDCGGGSAVIAGPVAPGNTVTCTSSTDAALFAAGTQTTSGMASASAINPTNGSSLGQLNASDPSVYTPVQLPAALAFTGPSQTYAAAGFLALAAGLALLLARSQLERRATTS